MKPGARFSHLDRAVHDRTNFNCGEAELDDFLKKRALAHMEAGVSLTRVLSAEEPLKTVKYPIAAYYTVSASTVRREDFPLTEAKKLPYYPVPVFLIAQLAVDTQCQGIGLGGITVAKALEYLKSASLRMPAVAIMVDCVTDDVAGFYERFGFREFCRHNGRLRLFLPMKTIETAFK